MPVTRAVAQSVAVAVSRTIVLMRALTRVPGGGAVFFAWLAVVLMIRQLADFVAFAREEEKERAGGGKNSHPTEKKSHGGESNHR